MSGVLYKFFPKKDNDKPYKSYEQYFSDIAKSIELLFSYYMEISDDAKGYILKKTAKNISQKGLEEGFLVTRQKQKCMADYYDAQNIIIRKKNIRSSRSAKEIFYAIDYVCEFFGFSDLEKFCFIVAFVIKNYENFSLLLPSMSIFATSKLTYSIVIDLFEFISKDKLQDKIGIKYRLQKKMSLLVFDKNESYTDEIILNEMVNEFVVSNGASYGDYKCLSVYYPQRSQPLLIMNDIADNIYNFSKAMGNEKAVFFYINGKAKMGKTSQVKRVADLSRQPVIFLDLNHVLLTDLEKITVGASRIAMLNEAMFCVKNVQLVQKNPEAPETPSEYHQIDDKLVVLLKMIDKLAVYMDRVFLLSEHEKYDPMIKTNRLWIDVKMRMPTTQEGAELWRQGLFKINMKKRPKPEELSSKFEYAPGQIVDAINDALKLNLWKNDEPLTQREFYSCIYRQVSHNLERKASLVYARHSWDKLILPKKEKDMLRNACNQLKYKTTVYEKWGMNDRITYGKGISMLFAGPPGTGKTMGAHVVANELGIEMYKVNLSQVVSKYIGETEKNLTEIFNEAKKTNVILFFDETDAILGKRTQVKDAHDKNANVETSFLLQKMEEYDGITVMTTNYIENIDNAFFRRISYVIHFPFPDENYRKKIWMNMFPEKMPVDPDIDFDYLAKQFEIAGGNIKNTVVAAAFLAASHHEEVSMTHIVRALKYEMSKQGKNMVKDDFGEYGFLLEET